VNPTCTLRDAAAIVLLLVATALGAQAALDEAPLFPAPAASAAAAEGWEGLFYNPAALGLHSYRVAAAGGSGSSGGDYEIELGLLDNLLLRYKSAGGASSWSFRAGLGFPVAPNLYAGVGAGLGPAGWSALELGTGLLYVPSRWLALGASAHDVLHPGQSLFAIGAAVRPFTERLTLFGDLLLPAADPAAGWDLALGLRAEPVDGVELGFRTEDRFGEWLGSLRLHGGQATLEARAGGDFALSRFSAGAVLGWSRLPARSVLNPRPSTYSLQLTRPLERNAVRRESLTTAESLIARLDQLAADKACRTLVLSYDTTVLFSADVLEELAGALARCKAAGKEVVSYLDNSFSQLDYLAAAAGSRVILSPNVLVLLTGVGGEFLFFKDLLDRLEVGVDYARSSEYKSALDRLLAGRLTEENRAQLTELFTATYDLMRGILTTSRKLDDERVRELIDGGPYLAEEAVSLGLADEVLYASEFEEKVLKASKAAPLTWLEYREKSWRQPVVAVVKAAGVITNSQTLTLVDRLTGGPVITEKNLVPVLEALGKDKAVAAVVLHIDSPGGDGFTSDRIWKAIEDLEAVKPVTVVMGATAASGGYYLAMAGSPVFAHETTVTGSIGSFIFKVNLDRLLARYGVAVDSIKLGENWDFYSLLHPLSEEQQARLDSMNRAFEERFYRKVAEARSLSPERVRELAGGRVYSGRKALELGLVDRIGGIPEALRWLEQTQGWAPEDYRIVYVPDWRLRLVMALQELRGQGLR